MFLRAHVYLKHGFLFWILNKSCFLGVDSLFNKTNCDRSAITDMLGGASGVTDANMMQVRKQLFAFYCNYLDGHKEHKI